MAVTIGDRIQSMIDHMDKGEIELGLSDVCIAIDATATKYYGKTKSSSAQYKKFIDENIWILLMTGFGNVISESLKLPFVHPDVKSDQEGYCTVQDIVYHVMRCGLVHSTGENSKIVWNNNVSMAINQKGILEISPSFIWGLALVVISCHVNKNERVNDVSWITTVSYKYLINDLWGKRDSLQNIALSRFGIKYS